MLQICILVLKIYSSCSESDSKSTVNIKNETKFISEQASADPGASPSSLTGA